jgi:cob(I)alamin adenosyltransferase
MVVLNRIYTRKGDKGETRLATGDKRLKSDPRIEAFGAIDETNAAIGLARLSTATDHPALDRMLGRIQNDLFDLGADLATPEGGRKLKFEALRVTDAQVERLEREIDELNAAIAPLNSFVLPGGSPSAARLHLARTICRRAERAMVALSGKKGEIVSAAALKFVNRLSDFLFVASRAANANGRDDVLWVPGKNR